MSESQSISSEKKSEILSQMKGLKVPFIANEGQTDKQVKFYAKTFAGTAFVTDKGEIVYSLPDLSGQNSSMNRATTKMEEEKGNKLSAISSQQNKGWVIKESFIEGSISEIKPEDKSATNVSSFIGNDKSKWKSNISTYDMINFGEVYKGIEVKLRAYGNNIEKLFYVKPGASSNDIKISLKGAKDLKVNKDGELEAETELGNIKFTKPVAYQEIEGKRVEVEVEYEIRQKAKGERLKDEEKSEIIENSLLIAQNSLLTYGFKIGEYDKTKELVIDPYLQSTYLGGGGSDYAFSISIDSSGNVYVCGFTSSTNFPGTTGGYQPAFAGGNDGFIAKLNSSLNGLAQSTYLGLGGVDYISSIAIDSSGNVYVCGVSGSSGIPGTNGGMQSAFGGVYDAFVAKFDSFLTSLTQSTYLGGSGDESGYNPVLTLDSNNNVYVCGNTFSTNFPGTTGGYQSAMNGSGDAFIARLIPTLQAVPVITSITPTSGPIGTSVTITGFDFNTTEINNIVYFGAVKANVTSASSTSLRACDEITVTNLL